MTPSLLSGKLNFVANFEINAEEANLVTIALIAICEQLEIDCFSNEDLTRVTALFTKDGSFEFINNAQDKSLGLHFSLAVYSMETIREKVQEIGQNIYLLVYIEELVHHYWRLEDEVETKVKVIEILNRIVSPQLSVTDVFPKDWLNAELVKQGK